MLQRSQVSLRLGVIAMATAALALSACSGSGDNLLSPPQTSAPSASAPGATGSPSASSPSATPSTTTSTTPSTTTTTTPEPGVTPVSDCVRQQFGALSLSARAGQVLMIGIPASTAHTGAVTVRKYRLGGMFLSGRSTSSVRTIRSRTDTLQAAAASGPGLLVATDQEGGSVQVLGGKGFTSIPSALTQGSWSPARLTQETHDWGEALNAAGITLNLAPVADTVTATRAGRNPPIGAFNREYGHDTQDVAAAVTTVITALNDVQVLSTIKHFPGLGRVTHNTDVSSLAVDSVATADDVYLQPFAAGIKAGAAVVMVSSARYPKLDDSSIAAFSQPIITGLLREQLGWTGVVMSDDLGQAKAVTSVPAGQRAVRFIRAGGDIVLSVRTSDAKTMRAALIAQAQRSPEFKTQLDAAVVRILQLKERAGLLPC